MKTVVNNVVEKEIKFPCLMKHDNGTIALFNSPTSGMILNAGDARSQVGHYLNDIISQCWTPLLSGESVTLIQE